MLSQASSVLCNFTLLACQTPRVEFLRFTWTQHGEFDVKEALGLVDQIARSRLKSTGCGFAAIESLWALTLDRPSEPTWDWATERGGNGRQEKNSDGTAGRSLSAHPARGGQLFVGRNSSPL